MTSALQPAGLTRRQLRALRELEMTAADPQSSQQAALTPMKADPTTEIIPVVQPRHRTNRRGKHRLPTLPLHLSASFTLPRAAVVATLGLATIVLPVSGVLTSGGSAEALGPAVDTQQSLLTQIDALAAGSELEGTLGSASALDANANALVIAQDLAARSQERTSVAQCATVEGASGLREANVDRLDTVYWPLEEDSFTITSTYGPRWGAFHAAIDMAATLGTEIHAAADGVVVHSGEGLEGRSPVLVIIESEIDGQTVWTWYNHMYPGDVFVSEGDTVEAGDVIGLVGSNGNSTGPHLHFEVHVGEWDNHVDPRGWLDEVGAIYLGSC